MELENAVDRGVVKQGLCDEATVRRATVEGVVDTGAVMLVLPKDVVDRLGLETQREVVVAHANEETRQVAGPVTVQIGNRFMNADCIVGPPLSEPLIGCTGSVGPGGGLCKSHGRAAPGIAGQSPAEVEVTRARRGFADVGA